MPDNESKINCPACGKIMHKIFMPAQNVYLDVCLDGCGGIYFDNREFKMFEKPFDDITPLIEAYKDKTFEKVSETDLRICPHCGMKMVKNYTKAGRDFHIDECYGCGARFLDYQELEKIRYGETAARYEKRPVIMPSGFYENLNENENYAETFAEINAPDIEIQAPETVEIYTPEFNENDFNNGQIYSNGAPMYVLDEREVKKEATKKGLLFGFCLGTIFSFLFYDNFTKMFPVILETNPEADELTVDVLYFLICVFVFSVIGICVSRYISRKNINRF